MWQFKGFIKEINITNSEYCEYSGYSEYNLCELPSNKRLLSIFPIPFEKNEDLFTIKVSSA